MPNIGTVLREEITRLSRRETRSQVEPARKAVAQQRKDIAELKRQVAQLVRQVALLSRKALGALPPAKADTVAKGFRFSAKRLQALRARMELSANDLGKLLGVSSQSVYNWEAEKARPRNDQLAKLAAVRGLGKREVAARLAQLDAAAAKAAPKE